MILLVLAACGVATPPRVATLRAAETPATIAFDANGPEDAPNPALAAAFRDALSAALAERNVATEPQSRYRLSVGLAVRAADAGVGQIEGSSIDWTSEPRRHHWYHACRAQRIDAVVAMRDSVTGAVTGRWRGTLDHCEPGEDQARALAVRFAQAMTNR